MDRRSALVAAALTLAACAAHEPAARESAPEVKLAPDVKPAPEVSVAPPAPAAASTNPTEELPLRVLMTGQTTTGRLMKLRARLENPYDEVVTGARIQLVFLSVGAEGDRVLEVQQHEIDSVIPPGDTAFLRWDVESMYLSSASNMLVAAYPKRLGDRDLPPPDHWDE